MNENSSKLPEAPDPLDILLRKADVQVPDDGFSARVMISLPPRRRFDGLRSVLLTVSLMAGVVVLLLHAQVVSKAMAVLFQHGWRTNMAALWPPVLVLTAVGSLIWALMSLALEEEA